MTAYPLGLYVGNPNGNDAAANTTFLNAFDSFKTLMGTSPLFMDTFVDFGQDPSQWDSNAGWTAWSWAQTGSAYVGPGSGVTPVIGVPLASNAGGWGNADTFYKSIIGGALDATYKGIVSSWAAQGYKTIQLRLGYEFDGNFMPWGPGNSGSPTADADFVAAWQHVANLVHQQGAASGITVQTVWNPADINWTSKSPASLYPGDSYVDIISTDAYSPVYPLDLTNWSTSNSAQAANLATWAADPANRAHYWQYSDATQYALTGNNNGWSFQDTVDLAAAHHKPLSVSETGAGNNGSTTGPADDPAFPQWLAGALAQAEARGVAVQNVDIWATDQSDGSWGFLNGEKPLEAAAWVKYFGTGSSVGSGSSLPVPTPNAVAPSVPLSTTPATITPAPAPSALHAASPAPASTSITTVDQGQPTAVNAVYVPSAAAWQQASSANPINTIVGQNVYAVVGVHSDGNIGAVLVTSTPVSVGDNQWGKPVSVVVSPTPAPSPTASSGASLSPSAASAETMFDAAYYLAHNPDVAASGVDPYQHYITYGWHEGRNPSAAFDTNDYLAANPDVKAAGVDPLTHYAEFGQAEGRAAIAVPNVPPDPLVDAAYIYAERPDVARAGVDATAWFDTFGWKEGTNPNPEFDTNYYLTQNPDVRAAGVNPLQHFEQSGWREGRDPSLLFSDAKYLAAYPDVAVAGVDPLQHYLSGGQAEGRAAFLPGGTLPADPLVNAAYYDHQLGATLVPAGTAGAQQAAWSYDAAGWQKGLNPDAWFNTQYYLAHNPDVAAAHVDPLLHYENYGWKEGRDPSAQFSTTKYLAAYSDVRAAGIDPLLHYIESGQAEGRQAFAA